MGRITLLIILAIQFLSCDDQAVIHLPSKPQRLVLNCIAQDTKKWQVGVTLSDGILSIAPPFKAIKNASVSVYENDVLLETISNTNDFEGRYFFKNSFPVQGRTYRISVSAPSYESVSSSFVQPMTVTPDSLAVTILSENPAYENGKNVFIRAFFTDPPGENHYGISIKHKTDDSPFPAGSQSLGLTFLDPSYEDKAENNEQYGSSSRTFTDTKFENKKTYLDFQSIIWTANGFPSMNFYTVTIRTFTKEYYEYQKAVNLQNYTRNDPFAQPVPVKGNVTNGFGIFTGYTLSEKTWELK